MCQVDIWEVSRLSLLCSLPHEGPVSILAWRPGLPGVLPLLLTGCMGHDALHVWAQGKGQPPATETVKEDEEGTEEGDGENPTPPQPPQGQAFGLWTSIAPFTPAGGAVAWLQWGNHGSTRASQHLASRVRHHGLDGGSSGGRMLKVQTLSPLGSICRSLTCFVKIEKSMCRVSHAHIRS